MIESVTQLIQNNHLRIKYKFDTFNKPLDNNQMIQERHTVLRHKLNGLEQRQVANYRRLRIQII
jgi:hypothetical protein